MTTAIQRTPAEATPWPRVVDDPSRRWLVYLLLAAIAGLLAFMLTRFHVCANGGTDQNGYLVTSRLMVEEGRMGFTPNSPFQFAGRMMVVVPNGDIYAKYPFGFPLLAAIGRVLGGFDGMYYINPLCTVLAVFFSFFLFRAVVGDLAALLGVFWLACNPVTLAYANDANSHASTLLCVVVGAWGLLQWWEIGGWWRGIIAGFALGYACTIRYTEFLLVLPLLFVVIGKAEFDLRRLPRCLAPLIGWAIPIGSLSLVCWVCFGAPWRTGYSFCREQTGFGLEYLLGNPTANPPRQGNWETLLYQLNHTGLFLILPVVLTGLIAMFWHSWKLATTLSLWIVPPTLLYLFYYWAPVGEESIGYLRFFLTVFPGMVVAGLWLLSNALHFNRTARALSLGLLTFIGTGINLSNILPHLERQFARNLALNSMVQQVSASLPRGAVLFAEESLCNQLDMYGGYELYDLSLFRPNAFAQFNKIVQNNRQDDPFPIQRDRALGYTRLLGIPAGDGSYTPKSAAQVDAMQLEIVVKSLKANRPVAMLFRGPPQWNMLFGRSDLHLRKLMTWTEPPPLPPPPGGLRTRWNRGVARPLAPMPLTPEQRRNQTWTLYQITRDTPPTTHKF